MGTPDEASWPGVSALLDYKTNFPKWKPQPLAALVPGLGPDGVDLLSVCVSAIPICASSFCIASSPVACFPEILGL
jgi:hypothetical protein